jgi:hypothetical protein
MSCEACDEREKKIDELLRTVKALKVDISGRSEITLLLQQKYEAEFHLRREVGGQLAKAVLQIDECVCAAREAKRMLLEHGYKVNAAVMYILDKITILRMDPCVQRDTEKRKEGS